MKGTRLWEDKTPPLIKFYTDLKKTTLLDGTEMYIDSLDSLKLGEYGIYEPEETELIKRLVKPIDVCLDIGAMIGYFTIMMAKQCRQVYAFEPELFNFKLLEMNLELNNLKNVHALRYAAAERAGESNLYTCKTNSGMHRLYQSKWCTGFQRVQTIKLDDFVLPVDFIKMDVEGAEWGALKGMVWMLRRNHPTIIMEFHPPSIEESGDNPEDIYNFLIGLGYDIKLIPYIDESISYDDLVKQTLDINGGRNILCQ